MRPDGPTSWLLSAQTDWRAQTLLTSRTSVSSRGGVSLAAVKGGAAALDSSDGSLGGLVLPRGMAFDGSLLLHLLTTDSLVLRFSPRQHAFEPLPQVGGEGAESRKFRGARNIAIEGRTLLVADTGNRRVQVFSLETFSLIDILRVPGWEPVDVAAYGGSFFILDRARKRVYGYRAYPGTLRFLFETEPHAERLAIDSEGRIYILHADESGPRLASYEFTDEWKLVEVFTDAGDVRDRFAGAPIRTDDEKRFCLPEPLRRPCDRRLPKRLPAQESPLGACRPVSEDRPRLHRSARGGERRYVADTVTRRVWMYLGPDAKLRNTWGPFDQAGRPAASTSEEAWEPVDVVVSEDCAYILDRRYGRVWLHRAGRETLRPLFTGESRENRWSRIAMDERQCLLLLDAGVSPAATEIYDSSGTRLGSREAASGDYPDNLARLPVSENDSGVFSDNGDSVTVDRWPPGGVSPVYEECGIWISKALDSRIYRCPWHKIELAFSDLPPGCAVEVSTVSAKDSAAGERPPGDLAPTTSQLGAVPDCTSRESGGNVNPPANPVWDLAVRVVEEGQLAADENGRFPRKVECLVQSPEGQSLWLKVRMTGDRFRTPVLREARIHYPREALLEDLPSVFSADEESRRFLDRFVAIFNAEFERIDGAIDDMPGLFDPQAVPAGPFLEYLAGWLALTLEGDWTTEQKRQLLAAAPGIYPRRGRADGLRDYIQTYLSAVSGLPLEDIRRLQFPMLLEGFLQRNHLLLGDASSSRLCGAQPLWSLSRVARLRLDDFAREGEAELVSTGDPDRDVFHEYAHRFRVFVPAVWIRSAAAERMLRRAIETEKPAHTAYDLCLVPSRLQVGVQSTVGVDTIVGSFPKMRLGCPADEEIPPGAEAVNALGRSSLLGCAGGPHVRMGLSGQSRIGLNTLLV